jgi:hypothetical protein
MIHKQPASLPAWVEDSPDGRIVFVDLEPVTRDRRRRCERQHHHAGALSVGCGGLSGRAAERPVRSRTAAHAPKPRLVGEAVTDQDSSDRWLVGLATVFDVPSDDHKRTRWPASAFRAFAQLETAIPLKINHDPVTLVYDELGRVRFTNSVGRAVDFALVDEGTTPAGLLALARLDEGGLGDSLLGEVRRGLPP